MGGIESMQDDSPKTITQRLLAALQEDEFVLYTQAITPLEPGADSRAFQEIFIRFREEDAKMLPPGSFFPLLEEYRTAGRRRSYTDHDYKNTL